MGIGDRVPGFEYSTSASLRLALLPIDHITAWPDPGGDVAQWHTWLEGVWAQEWLSDAVAVASPTLAARVDRIIDKREGDARHVRRAAVAVVKYASRAMGRATPFGMFAGVANIEFGDSAVAEIGAGHQVHARPDAAWVDDVVAVCESDWTVLSRLLVRLNDQCFTRGDRLVLAHPRCRAETSRGTEASVRLNEFVTCVMAQARAPVEVGVLANNIATDISDTTRDVIAQALTSLVAHGFLVSNLQVSSQRGDLLGHMTQILASSPAAATPAGADMIARLRGIDDDLTRHNHTRHRGHGRMTRALTASAMKTLSNTRDTTALVVDTRADANVHLPDAVAREAAAAGDVLTRLAAPTAVARGWQQFHARFLDRYGAGTIVPVRDIIDTDTGLGLPEISTPAPATHSRRDQALWDLATRAGRHPEVRLDQSDIDALTADTSLPRLPDMDIAARLHAASPAAIETGDCDLWVTQVSPAAGTLTGRFGHLLGSRADASPHRAQLLFSPLHPRGHNVAYTPVAHDRVVTVGQHETPDGAVGVDDLGVVADYHRLHLITLADGESVEVRVPHAMDLRHMGPESAWFLREISIAWCRPVTMFDWGPAAGKDFLPRLRYGKVILAPAQWRATTRQLRTDAPQWLDTLTAWREARQVPEVVDLVDGPQGLRLDLNVAAHADILKAHITAHGTARLVEAPSTHDLGWIGGHVHEIVFPLTRHRDTAPPAPVAHRGRRVEKDHGEVPGAGRWLYAKLFAHPDRHDTILADTFTDLVTTLPPEAEWWFIRYQDPAPAPDPHLRIRVQVPQAEAFGTIGMAIGQWAKQLRGQGLASRLVLDTYYPETGRYGTQSALDAAHQVFGADSALVHNYLAHPVTGIGIHAVAAAEYLRIAESFLGDTAKSLQWCIDHPPPARSSAPSRAIRADLDALMTGTPHLPPDMTAARQHRAGCLAAYRIEVLRQDHLDVDEVLSSLLHMHHNRLIGIDRDSEHTVHLLARAYALSQRRPARTS